MEKFNLTIKLNDGRVAIRYQPVNKAFSVGQMVTIPDGDYKGTFKIWYIFEFNDANGRGQNIYLDTPYKSNTSGQFDLQGASVAVYSAPVPSNVANTSNSSMGLNQVFGLGNTNASVTDNIKDAALKTVNVLNALDGQTSQTLVTDTQVQTTSFWSTYGVVIGFFVALGAGVVWLFARRK